MHRDESRRGTPGACAIRPGVVCELIADGGVVAAEEDQRVALADVGRDYFADQCAVVAGVDDVRRPAFDGSDGPFDQRRSFNAGGPRYSGEPAFRQLGKTNRKILLIDGQKIYGETFGLL